MTKPKVSILGLGLMGSGMAGRLLAANFPLTVYNRTPAKAAKLAQGGARLANSPGEAAAGAEIVLSMLADDDASRRVWLGDQGALAGASPGTILIESSTVTGKWVRELEAAAAYRQCSLLDAPVTGSKAQAAAGELCFLVGGAEPSLAIARPALQAMSKDIIHLGPTGSGAAMKLINNFLCGVQAASLAEALAWIDKSGLRPAQALAVLTGGAPGSPLVKILAARSAAQNYTPNFLLRLMAKDLSYALHEGAVHSLELKTAAAALETFKAAILAGYGEEDLSAVIKSVRRH